MPWVVTRNRLVRPLGVIFDGLLSSVAGLPADRRAGNDGQARYPIRRSSHQVFASAAVCADATRVDAVDIVDRLWK